MNYEIYKTARNASWKFLVQQNVTSLPVDLKKIVSEMGIIIKKDSGLLDSNENGRVINNNGQLVIIVRDISTAQNRYTIMHEIGHIVFGHADGITNDVDEYTVERFAIDVLAPACVLWGAESSYGRRYSSCMQYLNNCCSNKSQKNGGVVRQEYVSFTPSRASGL